MVLVILVVALVAYLYFFDRQMLDRSQQAINDIVNPGKTPGTGEGTQMPITPAPVKDEIKKIVYTETQPATSETSQDDLKRMAAAFAERFGSYSNQSNYANIKDLQLFMTRDMQQWSEGYIDQIKEQGGANSIYYGITTKAIYQQVENFDNDTGTAQILVKTQRREATGTMDNSSDFNQSIVIAFIKSNNAWKVDSATWQ